MRHIKDEERRKTEQERMEAVKASQANRKVGLSDHHSKQYFSHQIKLSTFGSQMQHFLTHGNTLSQIKHPLTEDTAKEVWEEKEHLPKVAFKD